MLGRKNSKTSTNKGKSTTSFNDRISQLKDKFDGGVFRQLNERLYSIESDQAFSEYQSDKKLFDLYHQGYRKQVEGWPLNPNHVIIERIRKNSQLKAIGDFGCGEAELGRTLSAEGRTCYNLDLIDARPEITKCNLSNVPLPNNCLDCAVFCLSLMGTDWPRFLEEAMRCLKPSGIIYIAEVLSRLNEVSVWIQTIADAHDLEVVGNKKGEIIKNFFVLVQFKRKQTMPIVKEVASKKEDLKASKNKDKEIKPEEKKEEKKNEKLNQSMEEELKKLKLEAEKSRKEAEKSKKEAAEALAALKRIQEQVEKKSKKEDTIERKSKVETTSEDLNTPIKKKPSLFDDNFEALVGGATATKNKKNDKNDKKTDDDNDEEEEIDLGEAEDELDEFGDLSELEIDDEDGSDDEWNEDNGLLGDVRLDASLDLLEVEVKPQTEDYEFDQSLEEEEEGEGSEFSSHGDEEDEEEEEDDDDDDDDDEIEGEDDGCEKSISTDLESLLSSLKSKPSNLSTKKKQEENSDSEQREDEEAAAVISRILRPSNKSTKSDNQSKHKEQPQPQKMKKISSKHEEDTEYRPPSTKELRAQVYAEAKKEGRKLGKRALRREMERLKALSEGKYTGILDANILDELSDLEVSDEEMEVLDGDDLGGEYSIKRASSTAVKRKRATQQAEEAQAATKNHAVRKLAPNVGAVPTWKSKALSVVAKSKDQQAARKSAADSRGNADFKNKKPSNGASSSSQGKSAEGSKKKVEASLLKKCIYKRR